MSCHVVRRPGREEGDDRISGIGATTPPLLGSDSPSTRSCPGLLPPAVGQSVLAVMHEVNFGEMKAGRNAFCYHYPSIFHVDDDERAAPSKLA